ncbi:TPA: site-specific DNA-methyltransferase [Mannheimia haemolytica]
MFSEGKIDFDKFQQLFSDNFSTEPDRYMLNWAGKSTAYQTLQTPTSKTLTPCEEESVDFENTQNIFIEGENLDVLKALQKSYFNSVKMIYIDPPYNTGNDFIYNDSFADTKADYAEKVGDVDEHGKLKRAFVRNSKENGHYHSNWLNMMLPRLHLAKNLLRDDGVIFISIDDNEQAQLKLLCDEVFGEENFYGMSVWNATTKAMNAGSAKYKLQKSDEYILIYGKVSMQEHPPFNLEVKESKEYPYISDLGQKYRVEEIQQRKNTGIKRSEKMVFPILGIYPKDGYRWTVGEQNTNELVEVGDIFIEKNKPYKKIYEKDENNDSHYPLWINFSDTVGTSELGKATVFELLQKEHGFETIKPIELLQKLIFHFTEKDSLIMDFFCGSGTTAHAVMEMNANDNGHRKYITVQLPEEISETSDAFRSGYRYIHEISKERIRRAGKQILQNNPENRPLDVGFKVFKLTESHFKQWQSPTVENLADQLEMFIDPVSEKADTQAVLYELLLRLGLKLTAKVRLENKVFWVEENGLIFALLLNAADEEIIQTVIAQQPKKVIALDRLFNGNDARKKNTELQMQDAGITFFVI